MSALHPSIRHEHTSDCRVPITDVTQPRNRAIMQTDPVHDEDGVCRYDIWEATEGCRVLRIPIFRAVR